MHVACNRHLSPGMDVGRAMGKPDSLKQTHDASHRHTEPVPRNDWCSQSSAATRAFPVLHPCSTPELLPTASSLYLILDFAPHRYPAVSKSHRAIKGFERDYRLHLSGWAVVGTMQQPFQLANSCPVQRSNSPQPAAPLSTGILARVGNHADLAIPCFCLKPLSHPINAPFHPPLSSVRRSALYPRAISSGQISVHRGGDLGFSSGFVPC